MTLQSSSLGPPLPPEKQKVLPVEAESIARQHLPLLSLEKAKWRSHDAPQTLETVPLELWRLEMTPLAETCGASLQLEATNLTLLSLPMRPSYATVSLAHLTGPAEPMRAAFAEAKRAAARGIRAVNCMMICVGRGGVQVGRKEGM